MVGWSLASWWQLEARNITLFQKIASKLKILE